MEKPYDEAADLDYRLLETDGIISEFLAAYQDIELSTEEERQIEMREELQRTKDEARAKTQEEMCNLDELRDELFSDLQKMFAANEGEICDDELAEWAEDFLRYHQENTGLQSYLGYDAGDDSMSPEGEAEVQSINELKKSVKPWSRPAHLPKFTHSDVYPGGEPDGELLGIGFIYDHDQDDRVLVAIKKLHDQGRQVYAVQEYKATLTLFSDKPTFLESISVCDDHWHIKEFVLFNGKWVALPAFAKMCVDMVLKSEQ